MKLKFKHQSFQEQAARAVVDVFKGQPYRTQNDRVDRVDFSGWYNEKVILDDSEVLENLRTIQLANNLMPSSKLEGNYHLTVEMETGVGKTYTYIKTIYELNKHYGWRKFIIVVPSIAIREGVFKSLEMTREHFATEYNQRMQYFIYNSAGLNEINYFALSSDIYVMIINAQSFNAIGDDKSKKTVNKIHMELDEFQSRKPIDVIASTNPIVIIDEPQSVEGKQTKKSLAYFNPLMTLRYSATHKKDSIYNMVYRLDAMDAYNMKLVKKIAVKGIVASRSMATSGYVYLEKINLSTSAPTATIHFDYKGKNAIRKIRRIVSQGDNLYAYSNELAEYEEGFTVTDIRGDYNYIDFMNGIRLYVGESIGDADQEQIRRIQIRETILSHIERERQLFHKGIKVLSLFFIDEVSHYRIYEDGKAKNGLYATLFEEEYNAIINDLKESLDDKAYLAYLQAINTKDTHTGYFSIDKKGKYQNSKAVKKEGGGSDDVEAYDLIMKNKELLLDINPQKSPARFIFSHSALREGWDNPNVFQICTLKNSNSEVRKRQEVGRGLRLCVNQYGERQDETVLNEDVHTVNVLTVIASESYDDFAKALQNEISEAVADRPRIVTATLFQDETIIDTNGDEKTIDKKLAQRIYQDLIKNDYIDSEGKLTVTYYTDKDNNALKLSEELATCQQGITKLLDRIYEPPEIENARSYNVEVKVNKDKLAEFKALWERINPKSYYIVRFDTDELVEKCVHALNTKLKIAKSAIEVVTGSMEKINVKDDISMIKETKKMYHATSKTSQNDVKYDLVGELVNATQLTRKTVIAILKGIEDDCFNQFKDNPETFILRASTLIKEEMSTTIIQHISYNPLEGEQYDVDIFTKAMLKGNKKKNAIKTSKHIYDHVIYDSEIEKNFAQELDMDDNIAVYCKLPKDFYINTPLGHYNPDWAIAFYEGAVKHIYFIAETKGSMSSLELRPIEDIKTKCAKKHFEAISKKEVVFEVVDTYDHLLDCVRN